MTDPKPGDHVIVTATVAEILHTDHGTRVRLVEEEWIDADRCMVVGKELDDA